MDQQNSQQKEEEIRLWAGLIEGRIVHFVLNDGPNKGQHRPAIIVRVWDRINGICNLQVFTDGSNDGAYAKNLYWSTSRRFDKEKEPGTWHWIELS